MRRLVTWTVDNEFGHSEGFTLPQTPEKIADEFSRMLTYPTFFTGEKRFALGVWALPEGKTHPDEVSKDEWGGVLHAGGWFQPGDDGRGASARQYGGLCPLRRGPRAGSDPNTWVPLSWNNGGDEPFTTHVHPEEVFTGQQAVPIFRAYILTGQTPPPNLLRRINI